MIELVAITKSFPGGWWQRRPVLAVDRASLAIPAGKTVGLVGLSGCGKSTLGRIALNLIPCDSGRVIFDGADLSGLTAAKMKKLRKDMQIIFQDPESSLNPRFTIGQSMAEPYWLHHLCQSGEIAGQIERWLQFVGLGTEILNRQPHQLSGGQLQRICIARALLLQPRFLVLDEPTSMLDVSVQAQVIAVLKAAQAQYGITYLFISHDLDLIRACSDEIAVMHQGKLVEHQPTAALFAQPKAEYTKKLLDAFCYF